MGVPWPVCVTKEFCSALNIDILPVDLAQIQEKPLKSRHVDAVPRRFSPTLAQRAPGHAGTIALGRGHRADDGRSRRLCGPGIRPADLGLSCRDNACGLA